MTRWNEVQLKQLKIGPLEIRFHMDIEDLYAVASGSADATAQVWDATVSLRKS